MPQCTMVSQLLQPGVPKYRTVGEESEHGIQDVSLPGRRFSCGPSCWLPGSCFPASVHLGEDLWGYSARFRSRVSSRADPKRQGKLFRSVMGTLSEIFFGLWSGCFFPFLILAACIDMHASCLSRLVLMRGPSRCVSTGGSSGLHRALALPSLCLLTPHG